MYSAFLHWIRIFKVNYHELGQNKFHPRVFLKEEREWGQGFMGGCCRLLYLGRKTPSGTALEEGEKQRNERASGKYWNKHTLKCWDVDRCETDTIRCYTGGSRQLSSKGIRGLGELMLGRLISEDNVLTEGLKMAACFSLTHRWRNF